MTNTAALRVALGANALFSLTCAALLLFWPSLVGSWLGVEAPLILQVVGAGLVIFAADLLHQATRPRVATWRALYASGADVLWVLGTIVLLALFPAALSEVGFVLVVSVAVAVLIFGLWQIWAIGKAHRRPDTGEYRHCLIVETRAPADAMWSVVSNLGDIQHYMPSLKSSYVAEDASPGVGAVRVCENRAGQSWAEECTDFTPGRSFTVRFLSEAPDFPYPAKTMRGGWVVIPDGSRSKVKVWWELTPKPRLLAPLILPVLAFQVDRTFPKIIHRMAEDALTSDREAPKMASPARAHLLPEFC